MECEKIKEELRNYSVEIVSAVWHGIDWSLISPARRMNIYNEFIQKIKSASMTGRVAVFLENICRKMNSSIPAKYQERILEIIEDVEKRDLELEMLMQLREESRYIVYLMRDKNKEDKNKGNQMKLEG